MKPYKNSLSLKNKLMRSVWNATWLFLFRPSPRIFFGWRRMLLNLFGARVAKTARVYPSAKIWAPWNLEMEDHSALGDFVDCYSVAKIKLEKFAVVSQYTYLCSASHDIQDPSRKLVFAPIILKESSWVAARSFIGMGVTIGEGAVVGATSSVYKDVPAWTVVGGNPAKFIKNRQLKDSK